MKKTLIALAAVAATGAAFAQSSVTLSGSYAAGYESTKLNGVKSAGFGTDTAAVKMSATEDLGGGLKAAAYVSLGGMARNATVGGEDAGLSLSGGFGTVHLRTIESAGQGITAKASAGAPGYDLHSKVFSANANIDQIAYVLPKMGDLTASVNYVDRGATTQAGTGTGAGTAGVALAQPSLGAALAYKAGAVDAGVDYTSWTRKGATDVASNTTSNRLRISGNYNLGMAKVGLGYSKLNRTGANLSTTETLIGLSAPVGALTVGATYGTSKGTATSSTAKKTGYTLGASYDLSKRTNVGFSTFSWKTAGVAGSNTGTRVLVAHSF
jgi:hypothetical protein